MSLYKRGRIYWLHIRYGGKEIWVSTKATDKPTARDFEHAYRVNLIRGEVDLPPIGEESKNPTIAELVDALEKDWEVEGPIDARNKSNFKVARSAFKESKARQLTKADVDRYIAKRQREGCAPATINRTTLIISQAYALAKIPAPDIRHLSEANNVRRGFFETPDFKRVLQFLPDDLKDFALFGFLTGWRKNEISTLTWPDIEGDIVRLHGVNAKNAEPRMIVLTGETLAIIERRKAARLSNAGVLTNFVFHRDGCQVKEFRKSWARATTRANCQGKLFHDLRRTAVRNLIRSGVHQHVAMKISGHKTASTFRRYDICGENDLRLAAELMEQYHQNAQRKVVAIT